MSRGDSAPQHESLLGFFAITVDTSKSSRLDPSYNSSPVLSHSPRRTGWCTAVSRSTIYIFAMACEAHLEHRRVMITNFTFSAVPAVPAASDSVSPDLAPLIAHWGDQDCPAPEMLLGPELGAQHSGSVPLYSGKPVDVLYTHLCGDPPSESLTIEMTLEASL